MNGMSLTVLKLDDSYKAEVLSYLDHPADTPYWSGIVNTSNARQNIISIGSGAQKKDTTNHAEKDTDQVKKFRDGIKAIFGKIIEQADELTKQDSEVGDGDLGIGASRASKNSMEIVDHLDLEKDLQKSLIEIGDVFSDGFGGSSGPMWGVFISKGASVLKPNLSENTSVDWINAYSEGLAAM